MIIPDHTLKTVLLMPLNARQLIVVSGAAIGVVATTVSLVAIATLGPRLGVGVGLLLGVGAGGAGAWLAIRASERLFVERFAMPGEADADFFAPGNGHLQVDDLTETLRQALRQLRQLQAENEDVEHILRSSLNSVLGVVAASNLGSRQYVVGLLDHLRQSTASLASYVSSLGEANERLASGAIDQSQTISRTTSTVEALSEKIDRISQNADHANEACERTREEARRGLDQVHHVIEGMDRLRAQIESNGRKARRLGDRSVEIGTIVELIRGISSRTDMLALNATIESVRAGEHGRGFAVVAEEIRKLAERTATATCDIGTLVEAIQADAHESVRALSEEQSEMEKELQRVRDTGSALDRICKVVEHSAQMVEGISRSSNDQVLAAQEIVRAMQRISEVSHLTLEGTTLVRESLRGINQCCERLQPLGVPAGSMNSRLAGGEESALFNLSSSPSARARRRLAASEATK